MNSTKHEYVMWRTLLRQCFAKKVIGRGKTKGNKNGARIC
jgi:hypothetical protein